MTDPDVDILGKFSRICDVVRTTLGPFGASKVLVNDAGSVESTTDGTAILDALDVDDPRVTLFRGAVDDFDAEFGDGSTTLVTLAGALLEEASHLHNEGLHPTSIVEGYQTALDIATEHAEVHSYPLSLVGVDAVAETALNDVRDPSVRAVVGESVREIPNEVLATAAGANGFDSTYLDVVVRLGGSRFETELVEGVVLDKRPISNRMPRTIADADVILLDGEVTVDLLNGSGLDPNQVEHVVDSFEDQKALADHERGRIDERIGKTIAAGGDVLFASGTVAEQAATELANRGVLAVESVDDADVERLSHATGARVVPRLDDVDANSLGTADVQYRRLAGRDMAVVEANANQRYTFLCRASNPRSADAIGDAIGDALAAAALAVRTDRVVPGGGAIELSTAQAVRRSAPSTSGRDQVAVEAFANALLAAPATLVETAGADRWRTLARLQSAHSEGRGAVGFDVLEGTTRDVLETDPIAEPTDLKTGTWTAATELAVQILRVDEVIPASE